MWNRFVAGLFYALAVYYVLHSLYLHSGPMEVWSFEVAENVEYSFSREGLYTVLGAGSLMLALLAEWMIPAESDSQSR